MYLEHFGLREAPFRVTPHTEFFFPGGKRGATLDALTYAITHDEGIVKVSGEVGSGKTMLCRALLDRLPDSVLIVYLANPSLSREEILFVIADGLGLQLPDGRTHHLTRALRERLTQIRQEGQQVIVLIDEAHAMPGEALEEICRLSNLELEHHKLLQFVLVGQPILDLRLQQPDMRQLRERVTHNFALEPFRRNDIADYLTFRLRAAGYDGAELFTPTAIQIIARASEGLTRRINILADKALLAAAAKGVRQIDRSEAKAAVHEAQFGPPPGGGNGRLATWLGLGAGTVATALAGLYLLFQPTPAADTRASPPALSTASAAQQNRPPEPPPASATAPLRPAAPAAPPDASPPPPAIEPPPLPGPPAGSLGPVTQARLAASASWLRDTPGNRYFIQLVNADIRNAAAIEDFLTTYGNRLDSEQLRAYRSNLSGRDRIGVIYGDFATPELAAAALNALPESLQGMQPFVRKVEKLR